MTSLRAALVAVALSLGTAAAQSQTGTLSGCVTTLPPGPAPGTLIEITGSDGFRRAVTAAVPSGCYEIGGIASGDYVLTASLQGFSTVRTAPVRIVSGTAARLDVKMSRGGRCECVDVSLADFWKPEFIVLHLRIVGREPEPPELAFAGSIARYAARVLQIWNADPATIGTEVSFLQFRLPGEQPYSPTEEVVAFLVWDPVQRLYVRVHDGNEDPMAFDVVDDRLVRKARSLQSIGLDQLERLTSRF